MAGNRRHIALGILLAAGGAFGAAAVSQSLPTGDAPVIQQALQSLDARRYEQAERQALALAANPLKANGSAWAIVASARQRRGRYASAAEAHRMFLASCESPEMRQYALEQIRRCEVVVRKPKPALSPSKRLSRDVLRSLADVHDKTYTESSDHFVVQARNPEVAKVVVAEAEVALDRVCRVILAGQDYPHSVRINVWPDHKTYSAHATDAPDWSGASFRYDCANGATTRQIDLTQRDDRGEFATIMLDRALPHEMCHLVLQELFGDATCPLFLNEGLAMMAESEIDNQRVRLAGKAIAGKARISLDSLFVRRRYDVKRPAVFYAESFSFVEFLHSRLTSQQFREFLGNVKGGCTVADALNRSLCQPVDESFIPALASAWEDHAIAQAQFLEALDEADEGLTSSAR